jgi:hypothetical protein
MLACAVTMLVAPAAAQAALSWSSPIAIDHDGGPALVAISCPSADQCTTIDGYGREVTFDPASPANATPVVIDGGHTTTAIDCPSSTLCVAVDEDARVVMFDPTDPGSQPVVYESGSASLRGISCPTVHQCTAVGSGLEVSFDPASPIGSSAVVLALTTPSIGNVQFSAVTCPTTTQCTGVSWNGPSAVTFDPASDEVLGDVTLPLNAIVTCASSSQCVAIDIKGNVYSFAPTGPSTTEVGTLASQQFLTALACPRSDSCVAMFGDEELTFDPAAPAAAGAPVVVQGATHDASAFACPVANECVVANADGTVASFDPGDPTLATVATLDTGNALTAVACPAGTSDCTGIDRSGQVVSFDPTSPGSPTPGAIDFGQPLEDLACPSASACVALDGASEELSFDPSSPAAAMRGSLGLQFSSNMFGLSCPSLTQCTGIDVESDEITFDPASPQPASTNLDSLDTIDAIACPSIHQCTAVDAYGKELTFDPTDPGTPAKVSLDLDRGLTAIACPSTTQCTAVGYQGDAVTFDPTDPGTPAVSLIDSYSQINAISCPALSECVAVDQLGEVLEGDPLEPGSWTVTAVAGMAPLTGVSCSSATQCVAVDSLGDASVGTGPAAVAGAPLSSRQPTIAGTAAVGQTLTLTESAWTPKPSGMSDQWEDCDSSGFDCSPITGATSTTHVLAPSDGGHTLRVIETATAGGLTGAAVQSAPTAVVPEPQVQNVSAPVISGSPAVGQTLNATHGVWLFSPYKFLISWERCDSTGGDCVDLSSGAWAPWTSSYVVTAADAGSTIRIIEAVSNGAAYVSATSAASAVVPGGSPAPPATGGSGPAAAGSSTPPAGAAEPVSGPAPSASVAGATRLQARLLRERIQSGHREASFGLGASGPSKGWQCALVRVASGGHAPKPRYAACGAAKTFKHLARGRYEFFVRVVGAGGTKSAAVTYRFRIG